MCIKAFFIGEKNLKKIIKKMLTFVEGGVNILLVARNTAHKKTKKTNMKTLFPSNSFLVKIHKKIITKKC